MRSDVGVWPRVMKRENMGLWERKGAVYRLCNGRKQEREAEKHWRRERENGEKRRRWAQ